MLAFLAMVLNDLDDGVKMKSFRVCMNGCG